MQFDFEGSRVIEDFYDDMFSRGDVLLQETIL